MPTEVSRRRMRLQDVQNFEVTVVTYDDGSTAVLIGSTPQPGAANGATNKVTASDTSQVLAAARATRRSIAILNESTTQDVRWSYGTASRTTGMLLPAGRSIAIETKLAIAIINVADGQAPVVSYAEDYD